MSEQSNPQVDFYILPDDEPGNRHRFVCRLANKAYAAGHQVYVHNNSAQEAAMLDELMWTFRQDSFLPHSLADADNTELNAVILGYDKHVPTTSNVLINLADDVPSFFTTFARVMEVISQDPSVRDTGRNHFRHYRDHGCVPDSHQIS